MRTPPTLGFALLATASIALFPTRVLCQERDTTVDANSRTPSVWTSRPRVIEAQFGYANPYGMVALAFDFAPLPWASLNAGAGIDFVGPQAGVMPRVRLFTLGRQQRSAFFLGAGLSLGKYCQGRTPAGDYCHPPDDGYYVYVVPVAYWANVAAGYEFRSSGGLSLRVTPGVGVLLNPGDAKLDSLAGAGVPAIRRLAASVSAAVGFAF